MAEVDIYPVETNSSGVATTTPTPVETQQPGGSGALRQVMSLGDPTTRANMAAVGASGQLYLQGYQPAPSTSGAVTTVSTVLSTVATGYNVATVTLRTFTGTTPSITFGLQASDDNTNWVTLQGINNTTGVVGTSFTQASALTAGTAGPSVDFTIGAYTNVRINITAISGTTPSAVFGLGLQSMAYEGSPGIASLPSLPTGANVIGALAANQSVNNAQIAGATTATGNGVSGTGTQRVNIASDNTAFPVNATLQTGANTIGSVKVTDGTNTGAVKAASTAAVATDPSQVVSLSPNNPIPTGTNSIGNIGTVTTLTGITNALPAGTNSIGTVQPGNTQNTTNWLVAHGVDANAKTGTSYWNGAQLATVTAMKASAGKLYDLYIYNPNSTTAYLQMFDLATGSVTLGTTVPKKSFPIPAGGYLDKQFNVPIGFATAISIAATTTATGLTAPTTGLVINGEYL